MNSELMSTHKPFDVSSFYIAIRDLGCRLGSEYSDIFHGIGDR